jgi:hypothetical protein
VTGIFAGSGSPTKVSPIITKIPVSPVTGIFAGNSGSPTKVAPISIFGGQVNNGGTPTKVAPIAIFGGQVTK